MTKLEALKDLAAKVEAGEATKYSLFNKYDTTWSGISPHERMASDACHGSLDAAKALHEAVLPDADFEITVGASGARARVYPKPCGGMYEAGDNSPARAWLLAIIRALIAQEDAK